MTSWEKERDRLVEQTLAFVQSVAAARGPQSLSTPAVVVSNAAPAIVRWETKQPAPLLLRSEREEIARRVEAFRAHQGKLIKERETYYLEVQARMRSGG